MDSRPEYRRLKRLTLPSSMRTVLAAPWKNGWFPDHTSTVYDFCVPLVVSTSSPLQNTCERSVHKLFDIVEPKGLTKIVVPVCKTQSYRGALDYQDDDSMCERVWCKPSGHATLAVVCGVTDGEARGGTCGPIHNLGLASCAKGHALQ